MGKAILAALFVLWLVYSCGYQAGRYPETGVNIREDGTEEVYQ